MLVVALAAAILAVSLAACGGGDGEDEGAAGGTMAGHGTTTMTDGGSVSVESPATDLRVTLDRILGEHALLAAFATQKGYAGEPDFEAIAAALDANSADVGAAVGSVYGEEAGDQFLDGKLLWRDHIGFFVDYTVGLAKKDPAAQEKAVGNLMGYNQAASVFLSDATGVPRQAIADAFAEHITQLKGQIDAYAAGRYGAAYEELREAYAHMFMTGDALSGAIADQMPDEFPQGDATAPAADLRVTLGRLLGEHAVLAMVATQKGYAGAADFEEIAAALDANSVDIADAIAGLYGDEAGKAFLDGKNLWRDHIGFFVEYTTALAKGDAAGQKAAEGKLAGYVEAFSVFLSDATGLPLETVRANTQEHVMQLKGQIDAYAAGDYDEAYRLARMGYAHMYDVGTAIAGAVVAQSPSDYAG
jgi:hypothetical protein